MPVLAVPAQESFPFFFLERVLGAAVALRMLVVELMERKQDLGMAPVIGTARAAGLQSHHGIMDEPWS